MSEQLRELAIKEFLTFYKNDLASESIDENNVVLSFPVHFSGFHRVELTITRIHSDQFVISDGAKTIEELKSAGYHMDSKLRNRLETISRTAKIRVVNEYLVAESNVATLGSSIQRFVEATKTIGDAYLVQRSPAIRDTNLWSRVGDFLSAKQVPFKIKYPLRGHLEDHKIDFYFPPNGVPGLALSVMPNPTKTAAEAWAYKSGDLKKANERTQVGVVYEENGASKISKAILEDTADVYVSSSHLVILEERLSKLGIL